MGFAVGGGTQGREGPGRGCTRRPDALTRPARMRDLPQVQQVRGEGPHRPGARRPVAADEGGASAAARAPRSSAARSTRAPSPRRATTSHPERGGEDRRRGVSADQGLGFRRVRTGGTYLLPQERHPHIGVHEDALVVQGADQAAQQAGAQRRKPLGAVHTHSQPRPRPLRCHPTRQQQVPKGAGR